MLSLKRIRTNPQGIKEAMKVRGEAFDPSHIDKVVELDEQRRKLLMEVEAIKSKKNRDSREIAKLIKQKLNADALVEEMGELSGKIKELDVKTAELDNQIEELMLTIPNIPNPTVPVGETDKDNVELRKWGEPRNFDFEAKAHWCEFRNIGF